MMSSGLLALLCAVGAALLLLLATRKAKRR